MMSLQQCQKKGWDPWSRHIRHGGGILTRPGHQHGFMMTGWCRLNYPAAQHRDWQDWPWDQLDSVVIGPGTAHHHPRPHPAAARQGKLASRDQRSGNRPSRLPIRAPCCDHWYERQVHHHRTVGIACRAPACRTLLVEISAMLRAICRTRVRMA